jgi:hypothetical protein
MGVTTEQSIVHSAANSTHEPKSIDVLGRTREGGTA